MPWEIYFTRIFNGKIENKQWITHHVMRRGKEGGREGWRKGGGLKLWFGLCYVPDTVNLKVGAPLVCGILQSILLQKILYGNL